MTPPPYDTPALTQEHIDAAWWSSVLEPADTLGALLRKSLGNAQAKDWVLHPSPGPLPAELYGQEPSTTWENAHARWHPRAMSSRIDEDLGVLEGLGGHYLIPTDPQWPSTLNDLGDEAPVGLWVVGNGPEAGGCSIVGARASTQHANRFAYDIAHELAHDGIPITSGGAFGADIFAHRGALDAHGHTTAVMAGGVGALYPASHDADFRAIIAHHGSIISEVPPMWRPARWRFLTRNRLVAALSHATVVIEAGMRSGALSTARQAMLLGRDVGALPGPVTHELSKGCNDLIRHGATLIRHAGDIMEMLAPFTPRHDGTLFGDPVMPDEGMDALPPTVRRVWETLSHRHAMKLNRIITDSGLSRRDVLAALAGLELNGRITSTANGWKRIAQ